MKSHPLSFLLVYVFHYLKRDDSPQQCRERYQTQRHGRTRRSTRAIDAMVQHALLAQPTEYSQEAAR